MKKTWAGINNLITSKNRTCHINQIQHGSQTIDDPMLMANAFNDFLLVLVLILTKQYPKHLYHRLVSLKIEL